MFGIRESSTAEIFALNREMVANKLKFRETWEATRSPTTHKPIDAILCPSAPAQAIPHDFPIWWGYTSLWNYLDYPSAVLPCKRTNLDLAVDVKDQEYVAVEGVGGFDQANHEICK